MTHNGRDHWHEMNAEQRARLIRDMPLVNEESDSDGPATIIILPLAILLGIGVWALIGSFIVNVVMK